ncbi:MAG: hypothetical protein IKE53_02725 [Clostridiales bacterium]|nr:hypothetical protein [Clostridiales bacterium]
MKNMKKTLTAIILSAIAAGVLAGCTGTDETSVSSAETDVTVVTDETIVTTPTSEPTLQTTEKEMGHFEFRPVVVSSIFREIMGEDMYEAYCNYVDAIRAGEDSFGVKDQTTYDWMLGQFPGKFYPVAEVYTESDYEGAVSNGRGTFHYTTSPEDFAEKNADFEKLVTGILNENLRDGYSDFEKVLALYIYFARNYTYDNDTYLEMRDHPVSGLSACRFLTTNTGICSECAPAFSYLLLQAGVDATTVCGYDHEWSYVTINGRNYHVDPTYALGTDVDLTYLMMTDERREEEGGFPKSDNIVASRYRDDRNGDQYDADDGFFDGLAKACLYDWDPDANLIYYYDENADQQVFDYSAFE